MRTSCRVTIPSLLILLSMLGGCNETPSAASATVKSGVAGLTVISGLKGTIEPCGCTSKPLGGLGRVAAEVNRLEKETLAPLLVVGDTFYELLDPPSERLDAERAKAEVIRDTLKELPVAALVSGERDELAGGSGWRSLIKGAGLPHMIYSRVRDSHGAVDSRIVTVNGVKLALSGRVGKMVSRSQNSTPRQLSRFVRREHRWSWPWYPLSVRQSLRCSLMRSISRLVVEPMRLKIQLLWVERF